MANDLNIKEPLTDQLHQLETALDTPPIQGELRGWAANLRKTFEQMTAEILHQIETVHPLQFEEIEKQDQELLVRVEELREEDAKNREWCRVLSGKFADFEAATIRAGADEKQVAEQQEQLLEDGLRFVMTVRRQEMAIRTWTQEAFERDTGLAD